MNKPSVLITMTILLEHQFYKIVKRTKSGMKKKHQSQGGSIIIPLFNNNNIEIMLDKQLKEQQKQIDINKKEGGKLNHIQKCGCSITCSSIKANTPSSLIVVQIVR